MKRLAATLRECTLAASRDALLPELVSGELRVKGANDFIQEATV